MLKFFYRLKRRGGVVLFAVIAIMTVLIVMASVAYFTARSSYQTVVSNYDFSQTYLSTTSVADMVLSAVAFDSYKDKDSGNDYSGLRDLLKGVETKVKKDISEEATKLKNAYKAANPDFPDDGLFPILVNEINYGEYGASDRKKTFSYEEDGAAKSDVASLNNTDIEALVVSGSTTNIKDKTGDDLIDASMDAPVKGGILDACEVKITLDWAEVVPVSNPESEDDKYTSFRYYYTFTTTGYYRGNSISVQDTVYHDATDGSESGLPQFDTFFTCSAQMLDSSGKKTFGTGRTVVINTKLISDNAYFQNENTVMTQIEGTSGFDFLGGVRTKGNLYITSDLKGTFDKPEGDRRHDWIIGGDLFIYRNANVNFNGNCLYVKGDLYLGTAAGAFENLGACFVEGNIYILDASRTYFTMCDYDTLGISENKKDEKGNITTLYRVEPQGVHIGKGVYVVNRNGSSDSEAQAISDQVHAYIDNVENEMNNTLHKSDMFKKTYYLDGWDGSPWNQRWAAWADHYDGSDWNVFGSCDLYYNSGTTIKIGSHRTLKTAKGDYDNKTAASFSYLVKEGKGETAEYKYKLDKQNVSQILSDTSNITEYDVYSAKDDAQKAVLTVDFDLFNNDDKHKYQEQGVGTVTSEVDGKTYEAKLKIDNDIATLTLPFVPGGYTLKWNVPTHEEPNNDWGPIGPNGEWMPIGGTKTVADLPFAFSTHEWHINICTGSYTDPNDSKKTIRTMPIILTANFFDGNSSAANGTQIDENGNNAFSWKFGDNTEGHSTVVQLLNEDGTDSAEDFVIFEMGNYKKGGYDESGKNINGGPYEKYSKDKVNSLETVVYYSPQKHFCGTKNQFEVLGQVNDKGIREATGINSSSKFDSFYKNKAAGQLYDTYENKLMIVSAKNEGRMAVCTGNINSTTTCGYIYAPNGNFTANAQNDAFAVFGGMIVSDYTLNHDNFLYAMPNPQLIEGLETGFDNITGDKTVASTIWHLDGDGTGKNYLG